MLQALLLKLASKVPVQVSTKVSSLRFRHPLFKKLLEGGSSFLRRGGGRIQKGPGRGLAFASRNGLASYLIGTHEPGLQRALVELVRPGSVFYDVGANCGFITVVCARLVGPQGKVIAFEPGKEAAADIRHNIFLNRFNNVELLEVALGQEDGEATFCTSEKTCWGMLKSDRFMPHEYTGEVSVPVRRLDSLTELPKPEVIKIDIEGGEVNMLRGAIQTLAQAKPVLLIEVHGTNEQVADILGGLGYASMVLGTGSYDVGSAALFSIILAGDRDRREELAHIAVG